MLRVQSLSKSFGATRAVDDVTIAVVPGEILAIVGENGAGKTTLMSMVAGELAPDRGSVAIDGEVGFVHQHFMLVPDFTIAENLALSSREPFRLRSTRVIEAEAEEVIAATGIALPPVSTRAADLSVGEKSKLELIKAIARRPSVLILDEPTSVLTPLESDELFAVVRTLASNGTAVIFISHKLREVMSIATRIAVMRRGRIVHESAAGSTSAEELAAAMVELPANAARRPPSAPRTTHDLVLHCDRISGEVLRDASLEVGHGEVVALLGVAGNGQSELAAILRGLRPARSGNVLVHGQAMSARQLLHTTRVGHIPEDRTRDGIVAEMSLAENIALTSPRWHPRDARRSASQLIELYSIRALGATQAAGSLSGGNQQKVILARELDRRPELLIAAEPTRGLDVEATRFVHDQLRAAAGSGTAILLITSDLDEAFALADAIQVIYRGRISNRLSLADAPALVPSLMAGVA